MKWSNKMTKKFDIAAHLKSDDDVREFLQEVANTGDTADLLHALNIAARAKGVTKIAKKAGVSRTSLYKSLAEDANPGFDTVNKIVHAMGYKLEIS
jgi:probable addiction module antidote protein